MQSCTIILNFLEENMISKYGWKKCFEFLKKVIMLLPNHLLKRVHFHIWIYRFLNMYVSLPSPATPQLTFYL